jgi:hypothetical protein
MMNDNASHNQSGHDHRGKPGDARASADVPTDLSRGEILRACADGESWAEARLADAAREGDVSSQLAFERDLRLAVGRCCENEPIVTPEGLRESLQAALRESGEATGAREDAGGSTATSTSAAEPKLGSPGSASNTGHSSILARIGPFFAVAAVLLLGVALVFNALNTAGPASGLTWDASRVQSVSSFITRQHDDCSAFGDAYERKFTVPASVEDGERIAGTKLGGAPEWFEASVLAMTADDVYEFAGIAGCGVPGGGASVHLIFRPVNAEQRGPVSVFIQRAADDAGVGDGACYACGTAEKQGRPVNFWTAPGGFVVYVHAGSNADMEHTRKAFVAPDNIVRL